MPKIKPKKVGTASRRRPMRRQAKQWYDKKYSVGEVAHKAWTTAKYIAGLVNVETKIYDTGLISLSNTQFSNAGVVTYLSGVGQGADYNQRNGNSIKAQYQNIYAGLVRGSADSMVRVILFRDREQRQALPAVSDVLESVDVRSNYNHNNLNRFTIMKDDVKILDTYHPYQLFTYNRPLKTHVYYNGTGATIASADENSIFILFLSETSSGANSPTANFNSRLGYVDN